MRQRCGQDSHLSFWRQMTAACHVLFRILRSHRLCKTKLMFTHLCSFCHALPRLGVCWNNVVYFILWSFVLCRCCLFCKIEGLSLAKKALCLNWEFTLSLSVHCFKLRCCKLWAYRIWSGLCMTLIRLGLYSENICFSKDMCWASGKKEKNGDRNSH